jgi:hypothetical protein
VEVRLLRITTLAIMLALVPATARADLSGGTNFYTVSADASGWFGVTTGRSHSALAGHALMNGGFGYVESFTSKTRYDLIYENATLSPIAGGVRQDIHPAGPDSLVIQQDTTVSGATEASSLVKETLRVQNTGTAPVDIGARIAVDVIVGTDDGPSLAPEGPQTLAAGENRIVAPAFRTLTLTDDATTERTRWTVAASGLNTTPPDVLDVAPCCYGPHGPLLPEDLSPGANAAGLASDSEIRWVWGRDAAHPRRIQPGKTVTFTIGGVLTRADFAPANTAKPSVPGTPRAGLPLEAAKGTWRQTALTNYAYQWLRCDAAGAGCTAIEGARDKTFTPAAGDVGRRLKVRVTADGGPVADSLASNPVGPPDAVPPAVQAPDSAFAGAIGAGASVTTTPVGTSWSGSDDTSGICSYKLEVARDGGAFAIVKLKTAASTAATQNLAAGSSYVYRVTATDCSGNTATAIGAPVTPRLNDLAAGADLKFTGSWGTQGYAYAFGGALRYSTLAGAKIAYTATAHRIAFAARPSADRGVFIVSVDGGPGEEVDLAAVPAGARAIVFQRAFPAGGRHTVTVTNLAKAGRPRVEADAFAAL